MSAPEAENPGVAVPNPGSDEALNRGCLCAVLDNCHGKEAPFPPDGWYITIGCPLHTPPGVAP